MIDRINGRRRAAGEGGFTLIELLVVIIILGILAAVVVFAVGGIGDRGQGSACTIDRRTLRTAAEAYYANDQVAPTNYGVDLPDYVGAGPAPRLPIDEGVYVTAGFLSEISDYHNIQTFDADNATGITPAIEVTVQVTSCGNPGDVV